MQWLFVVLAAAIGYLLGSIPVGLWVTRMYGVDIRTVHRRGYLMHVVNPGPAAPFAP